MTFIDFLMTSTKRDGSPLRQRTVEHYSSGLKAISDDMMREKVISKPLMLMDAFELDVAIALIIQNSYFKAKDFKEKRMYSNALKHYRLYVSSFFEKKDSEKNEINKIKQNKSLAETEKEIIVKARIGQGLYRENLLKKYDYKCIITKINLPEVLIASHIKPWSVSNNNERISSDNGFILSSTYDQLFDKGLISFQDDGKILISRIISRDNANKLGLDKSKIYDIKFVPAMKEFLQYHRDVIFVR